MVMISDSLFRTMLRVTGAVVVTHPGGRFEAHFDNGHQDASFDVDVESTAPRLTARTIDVASIVKDTELTVHLESGPQQWRFEKHEPDGLGESRIELGAL